MPTRLANSCCLYLVRLLSKIGPDFSGTKFRTLDFTTQGTQDYRVFISEAVEILLTSTASLIAAMLGGWIAGAV